MKAHVRVLMYIPVGEGKAIRRKDLKRMLGIPDRSMRDLITYLRLCGWPVLNHQDGRGYYLADNEVDVERFRRQELARARKIEDAARSIRYIPTISRARRRFIARAA